MPSFLRDLSIRRRSKASFKTADSSGNSLSHEGAEEPLPSKSSSTLSSSLDKQSPLVPLSSNPSKSNPHLPAGNGNGNGSKTPPLNSSRPRLPSSNSNRYSLTGVPTSNGERPTPATSPFAPRVLSLPDGSWVNQKLLLIFGQCADPNQPLDGTITVNHHQDQFPPTHWPVSNSHFKAIVYLQPGRNRLRLDFTSPKLAAPNTSNPAHSSWIHINYLPANSCPPLQLCILVAKDSPETYDAVPERVQKEGNGLDTAVRKFRMAAQLWQMFTAEQMNRAALGRRCFRFEEEWQPGTLSARDAESGQMRNETKIHIIRLPQTVKQVQDLNKSQQFHSATKKGALFDIAKDAVRAYFSPKKMQPQYVSCMFFDTHWDKEIGTIRGHAALGGGDDALKLGIFGSHCLQSYPSHIEEVVPAFSDCTRTDINHVANDCNEAGSNWEAANIGIGAHLHETGHLLGCPHQEFGVMARDYTRFNRTFTTREPYSTRTKQQGQKLCLPKDECSWHRLDMLRFRFHPCFQLPTDQPSNWDASVQMWAVDNGTVLVTANTGVAWVEIRCDGEDICHHWIEYIDPNSPPPGAPRQITLTEQQIKDRLPEGKRKKKNMSLSLKIFSCGGGEHEVENFSQLCSSEGKLKLPDGRAGFRSSKLGKSQMDGSQPQELILGNCLKRTKSVLNIKVWYGQYLDGIEFMYEDKTSDLFGTRRGDLVCADFPLDTRKGEMLLGFYVRAGLWIDGIQIMTTTGRRSPVFGKPNGGEGYVWYTMIPPRGYSIAGIYGSCARWLDGFGLIITR